MTELRALAPRITELLRIATQADEFNDEPLSARLHKLLGAAIDICEHVDSWAGTIGEKQHYTRNKAIEALKKAASGLEVLAKPKEEKPKSAARKRAKKEGNGK